MDQIRVFLCHCMDLTWHSHELGLFFDTLYARRLSKSHHLDQLGEATSLVTPSIVITVVTTSMVIGVHLFWETTATMVTYFHENDYSKNRLICDCVGKSTQAIEHSYLVHPWSQVSGWHSPLDNHAPVNNQSRTESPLAFWSAGGRPKRL